MLSALGHLARVAGVLIGVTAAVFWPCAPGRYDPLALPLSSVARCVSWALLLFVPIGVGWWCRDTFVGRPAGGRLLRVALVIAATATGIVFAASAAAFGGVVLALACASLAGIVVRWRAARWIGTAAAMGSGTSALLYLSVVPGLVLGLQLWLFEPAVAANRARVITSAGPLIAQLEAYRTERGEFPESLLSVTTDYPPRATSVPRFWYERAGAAYNLVFEQPPAALDMREFVVYNPAGHAVLTSHDSDLLLFQGDDLERRRGFPSSADVPNHPGWRVFRFD